MRVSVRNRVEMWSSVRESGSARLRIVIGGISRAKAIARVSDR